MLWLSSKKKQEKEQNERLLKRLQDDTRLAENERADQIGKLVALSLQSTPAVDFAGMKVVSIERIVSEENIEGIKIQIPCTVIGYAGDIVSENSIVTKNINEWYIRCNDKHHEQLVKEFKEFIAKRKQYFDGNYY